MKEIIGTVEAKAKGGLFGIRISNHNKWLNPIPELIPEFKEAKLIGKYVQVKLTDEGQIQSLEIISEKKEANFVTVEDDIKEVYKEIESEKKEVEKEVKNHFSEIKNDDPKKWLLCKKLSYIQINMKVPKGKQNKFGNFSYRSCSDILEACKPFFELFNVAIIIEDSIKELGTRIYVKSTAKLINCESGDNVISVTAYARESKEKKGMDSAQVTGSTSSYARKYALNGLLAIDDTADIDSMEN